MDNQALKDLDNMMDKLGKLHRLLEFIAATAAYQTIFGKGKGGAFAQGFVETISPIPGASGILAAAQGAAVGAVADKPPGTDTGTPANAQALAALGQKVGEASLGSGVIGVGASPQIAMQQEANDKLASIDSKLGELVKGTIDTDFTKSLGRKYQLPAR